MSDNIVHMLNRQTITYCEVCNDGWSDENFMLGVCCGRRLKTRPETTSEYRQREAARKRILERADKLDW